MDVAVTTSRRSTPENIRRATRYARALHAPYIPRAGRSLAQVMESAAHTLHRRVIGVLVVTEENLSVWTPQSGSLYYHPGMALNRVAALRRGGSDPMVEAMQLRPGDHVLDCTAGLASDAVVCAHVVGSTGRVLALESVAVLALLLKNGLARYCCDNPALNIAMRRVRVRHIDHKKFLASCPPASFDIVYFDPMFSEPVATSHGIAPLRPLANYDSLTTETLDLASSVARRFVVVKDRKDGPLHTTLEWDDIRGGRRSRIVYLLRNARKEVSP
ncbi:MAG: class I SAM-dependent methyltransferase [Firmicutes bacterium]|nr:class I SAM-dependent methyltransferase [Bacillota bacterium]